ncbi:MAG: hypothetical protein JO023_17115, partial [Chloroflexi bacterium]|nr:hypothetical protein [Chloroflexota bacterium]
MSALGLSLAFILCWGLIGWAALSVLWPCTGGLRRLLLAPSAGIAVLLPLVFTLNRLGLPIEACGPWLTLVLVIGSVVTVVVRRSELSLGAFWPF